MYNIPSFIHIYGKGVITNPDLEKLLLYLKALLPESTIDVRTDFISYFLNQSDSEKINDEIDLLAEKLAGIRVLDYSKQKLNPDPLYAEIDYERRKILNPATKSIGVFYDSFELQNIFYAIISKGERTFSHTHIVFTNQLIAAWDEDDSRYHARSSVYGFPSIISTAGIIEAPAKPREFYLLKQQYGMMGREDLAVAEFKKKFEGRFIEYNDPRMTEVCKGYVLQAFFFHIAGEPFCEDKGCRLFNAHWQEELIYSQLESPYEFCEKHAMIIERKFQALITKQ
ncbi:MAG: hypothetical protein HY578_07880 [Nitrospinae bacterium]|nr:hypothetical protein [Nitrospinota bacterium]